MISDTSRLIFHKAPQTAMTLHKARCHQSQQNARRSTSNVSSQQPVARLANLSSDKALHFAHVALDGEFIYPEH